MGSYVEGELFLDFVDPFLKGYSSSRRSRSYKIPVTQTLSTDIRHGTYPPEETRVTYCYPCPARRHSEGMKPLDNRREILKCYEVFKVIVGI